MNESADNIARLNRNSSRSESAISLFVIAHQDIYVDGLVRVISDHPKHHVVACRSPEGNCFEEFCRTPADLLLIEQSIVEDRLQNNQTDDLLGNFRSTFPKLHIIVLGRDISDDYIRRMLRAGVRGFIDSNTTKDLLATAIQEVCNGGYWVGRKVLEQLIYSSVEMEQIIEQDIRDKIELIQEMLTRRESDVLQRVLEGMSTREIANDLSLSEQSIKLHLGRLFKKFEVTNRSQLILMTFQRVSPAGNIVKLFRKTPGKHRIDKGNIPSITEPLVD